MEARYLLAFDFGDAPDSSAGTSVGNYQTSLADNGPRHEIVAGLFLGANLDDEADAIPNATANGDDVNGALPDDEDGVIDPANDLFLTEGTTPRVRVNTTNTTGADAMLFGWIDYNSDGVFDNATERASAVVANGAATEAVILSFPTVPDETSGTTYARFRLSTDSAADTSTGPASDGEVEDYVVEIVDISGGMVTSNVKIGDGLAGFVPNDLEAFDRFGFSIASIGDLNGDRVGDLAVGAPSDESSGTTGEGAVYVMLMNDDGSVNSHTKISDGQNGLALGTLEPQDRFGSSVAHIGDLNGDGIGDLAVGAVQDEANDGTDSSEGAVYILLMSSNGSVKSHTKISNGLGGLANGELNSLDKFGSSLADMGDLNGDGISDLAVGSRGSWNNPGAVFVLLMNDDGTVGSYSKISNGMAGFLQADLQDSDGFGYSLANLGDIDGDGLSDIAVGAALDEADDGIDLAEGAVYVLMLDSDGSVKRHVKISDGLAGFAPNGLDSSDLFGTSLTGLGDFDGDSVPDLAVGAEDDEAVQPDGNSAEGAVYLLFLNSDATVKGHQKFTNGLGGFNTTGLDMQDRFGSAIANLGDLDGNGIPDLAVGASRDEANSGIDEQEGALYLLMLKPLPGDLVFFGDENTVSNTGSPALSVSAADFDADGDLDLLGASTSADMIAWYENDGNQNFTEHALASGNGRMISADVNGDGRIDVVIGSGNVIAWHENNGAPAAGLWPAHTISTQVDGASSVFAADIDGDGNLDVLSTSTNDDRIAWHRNDGNQNFTMIDINTPDPDGAGPAQGNADRPWSVFAADLDSDGDLDVISTSLDDDQIAWYENQNNEFIQQHVISTADEIPYSLFAADIDSDGDLDVVSGSGSPGGDGVVWLENDNLAFTRHVIDVNGLDVRNAFVADMNGDGRLDIVTAASSASSIQWFENDGSPSSGTWSATEVINPSGSGLPEGLFVADVDADSDLDIVSGWWNGDDRIAWYQNSPADLGDAPAPFPTTLAENGARHEPFGPTLGANRDTEHNATHSAGADSDDTGTTDDEDGVNFVVATIRASDSAAVVDAQVEIDLQNANPTTNKLDAWIDFNGDGDWNDPAEQIFASFDLGTIDGVQTLSFTIPQDTGDNVASGTTFARFRLSTTGGLLPTGAADNGEVEDHAVFIGRGDVWWISPSSGNWNHGSNWSTGVKPAATQEVFIGVSGVTVTSTQNESVRSVDTVADTRLVIVTGTFTLGQTDADVSVIEGNLTQSAILEGPGALYVSGEFNWTGGSIDGVSIVVDGELAISGASSKTLTAPMTLNGVGDWSSGLWAIENGGVFSNAGELTITSDGTWSSGGLGASDGLIHNLPTGTITKTGGPGETAVNVEFNNDGVVQVQSGTIRFTLGNSTGEQDDGAYDASAGGTIQFGGGSAFLGGGTRTISGSIAGEGALVFTRSYRSIWTVVNIETASFDVTGQVTIEGATSLNSPYLIVNFNVPLTLQDVIQSGGTLGSSLSVPPVVLVDGEYRWSGGRIHDVDLRITDVLDDTLTDRPLVVSGTVAISGSSDQQGSLTLHGVASWEFGAWAIYTGGAFHNKGELTLHSDNAWSGEGVVHNQPTGTITKVDSTGETHVDVEFNNDGLVTVESGTMRFTLGNSGGEQDDGAYVIEAATEIQFGDGTASVGGGTRTIAGSIRGEGDLRFTRSYRSIWTVVNIETASFDVTGQLTIEGATSLNSPSLIVNVNVPLTLQDVTQSGGTLGSSLSVPPIVLVDGEYRWSGGTIQDVDLQITDVLDDTLTDRPLVVSGSVMLSGRSHWNGSLTLNGVGDWSNGDWAIGNGGIFRNAGELAINFDVTWSSGGLRASDGLIHNLPTGTITKTGGPVETAVNVEFNNDGVVHVQSGTMRFTLGNSAGEQDDGGYDASTGATIQFGGGSAFLGGGTRTISGSIAGEGDLRFTRSYRSIWTVVNIETTRFDVTGQVTIEGETSLDNPYLIVNFNVPLTFQDIAQTGGRLASTLSDPPVVLVDGEYRWTGGTIQDVDLQITDVLDGALTDRPLIVDGNARKELKGSLTLNGEGIWNDGDWRIWHDATFRNAGTLTIHSDHDWTAGAGGTLTPVIHNLPTGRISKAAGTSTTEVHPEFINDGGVVVNVGTIRFDDSTTNNGGFTIAMGATLHVNATLTNLADGILTGGTFYVVGTLRLDAQSEINTNQATIHLNGTSSRIENESSANAIDNLSINGLNGRLLLSAAAVFTSAGFFDNHGLVWLLHSNSKFVLPVGSAFRQFPSGQVFGWGHIEGKVKNAGSVAPGQSPGVLTIDGEFEQESQGTLAVELGGLTPGNEESDHDQLVVVGSVSLGGTLDVSLYDGFQPSVGDSFVVLENDESDPIVGQFDALPEGSLLVTDGHLFQITYAGGDGNDVAVTVTTILNNSAILDRRVFYNDSAFDGDAGATINDDNAIAIDKSALLPGETATFMNYITTAAGITGIMVDVAGPETPVTVTADDFSFRVGNRDDPSSWGAAPTPQVVVARELSAGIHRFTLIWPAGSIVGRWLQVTVKPTAQTGLANDDVFCFGNAPGESGNSPTDALVNATDFMATRANPSNFLNPAAIDNPYDYNRDGRVNATDLLIVRDYAATMGDSLNLITPLASFGKQGDVVLLSELGGTAEGEATEKQKLQAAEEANGIDTDAIDLLLASMAADTEGDNFQTEFEALNDGESDQDLEATLDELFKEQ